MSAGTPAIAPGLAYTGRTVSPRDQDRLNALMLRAYEQGDHIGLITHYAQAGDLAAAKGDIGAACFFWTQAYVIALEMNDARAAVLHRALIAWGREE